MELWDSAAMDVVAPAMIEFARDGTGGFQFVAVEGYLDYGVSENCGRPRVEFVWEGSDDGDRTSGRGWVEIENDITLRGHIYCHLGDDSGFVAVRPDGGL
jgi:hypothetical protein